MMRLLEGALVDDDTTNPEVESLRAEVRQLRAELSRAHAETHNAQRDTARAVGSLRKQLTPLYRALQAVFGEIDNAGFDEEASTGTPANARTVAVWESWKSRLPGQPAKVIDALLLHGEMNAQQIAIAIGCHRNSVPQLIFKLNKAGLINKNGHRFSLKTL